jgi:acetolactate synthase-1/2/3 large subunit
LHQLDDQQASARNVTKATYVVRDAAQLPGTLADAWTLARTAPAGPTWVEVPEDVLLGEAAVPPVTGLLTSPAGPRRPRPEVVTEAARLLAAAERPVLLAGGGVRRSPGGPDALVTLAELLDSSVVSTPGGKGAIPFSHPLSAASWIEDRHTTDLLEQADVLLAVGTSFGEVTSNYFTFAPRGQIIQVDAEARVLGSNHPVLGVHADAAAALRDLTAALGEAGHVARPAVPGAKVAAGLRSRVEGRLAEQHLATERTLLADLRAAVPARAETFWDMTIAGYWAWSAWDPALGGFHSAQASGGLGTAFPAAVGAAIGTGRRTFAVSGDGGSMYSIAELGTARQHEADVT